ncbi:unnamed protein product [Colias eurytheme]|nr:unnamed protein product [Colias eurytheme]
MLDSAMPFRCYGIGRALQCGSEASAGVCGARGGGSLRPQREGGRDPVTSYDSRGSRAAAALAGAPRRPTLFNL